MPATLSLSFFFFTYLHLYTTISSSNMYLFSHLFVPFLSIYLPVFLSSLSHCLPFFLSVFLRYASITQSALASLGRNIDLVSVIDDFGDLIYREIDYRAEAVNAQRFAELYASIPDVFVPKIYTGLSTSKVFNKLLTPLS